MLTYAAAGGDTYGGDVAEAGRDAQAGLYEYVLYYVRY
jgi:hypothetical protein